MPQSRLVCICRRVGSALDRSVFTGGLSAYGNNLELSANKLIIYFQRGGSGHTHNEPPTQHRFPAVSTAYPPREGSTSGVALAKRSLGSDRLIPGDGRK